MDGKASCFCIVLLGQLVVMCLVVTASSSYELRMSFADGEVGWRVYGG